MKLQAGEYVSLGKVEAELKTCPVIDNICVYADPLTNYCVALIAPNEKFLREIAESLGINGDFEKLCDDQKILNVVLNQLSDHAKKHRLLKFETPIKITLCKELWSPESGLVTAAFKIKRREIQEHYKSDILRMYSAR